jgi:hypothetical protein
MSKKYGKMQTVYSVAACNPADQYLMDHCTQNNRCVSYGDCEDKMYWKGRLNTGYIARSKDVNKINTINNACINFPFYTMRDDFGAQYQLPK